MVRLCTEILPTGSQCRQFALRGRPWCREHAEPRQRERTADSRRLVAGMPQADLLTVVCIALNAVHEFRTRVMPPLHAEAILDAAATRIEELILQSAQPRITPAGTNGCKIGK